MLVRYARIAYGAAWHQPLADALRVNRRTVRRWGTGEALPPASIIAELLPLLQRRRAEIDAAIAQLRTTAGPPDHGTTDEGPRDHRPA